MILRSIVVVCWPPIRSIVETVFIFSLTASVTFNFNMFIVKTRKNTISRQKYNFNFINRLIYSFFRTTTYMKDECVYISQTTPKKKLYLLKIKIGKQIFFSESSLIIVSLLFCFTFSFYWEGVNNYTSSRLELEENVFFGVFP